MKILYLSVMLFCVILAFLIPGISVEESITVSTDNASYHYGDNYTISGKVSPVVPNEAVSILILSTNYQHPESLSVIPNSEGRYLHTLSLPIKDISDGNFTIVVQYAGAKNQTAFNYTGLPCYQQNIPTHVYPAPIIRGPPASNPRILDSLGNAIIGPVKVGQQIQIIYPLANGLNCNLPFVYVVQIQDHNGITISLSWITGTLLAGQSFNAAQSWTPQHHDTYTAQIFTWQSLDNPNALEPPSSITFDIESNENSTKSSQIVSEMPSKFTAEFPTTVQNSPLKQFKSGIGALDVICKTGLQLVIKSEDLSPACVTPDTSSILVKRGWTHDNIILPKNLPHVIIPPLNDTNSGKPEATNENKNSSPLQLFLSVDSEYENPGGPISIDVGLNNTASVPLTLEKSDNWPRNDLSSGLCSNLPFGISILKGYYTEQNMSSARSLVIYQNVPCPLPPQIKSYTFQPLSTKATQECDTLFSCTGLVDMKTHIEINGFVDNKGQHQPFKVGTYTIIAGDEWGHVSIQHFTEEYATAYSNQVGK